MGSGIDAARALAPEHARALDDLKDQLLLVLIRRLVGVGAPLVLPVSEVDDTGGFVLEMSLDARTGFTFTLQRKQ